jgi:hypothetical protein
VLAGDEVGRRESRAVRSRVSQDDQHGPGGAVSDLQSKAAQERLAVVDARLALDLDVAGIGGGVRSSQAPPDATAWAGRGLGRTTAWDGEGARSGATAWEGAGRVEVRGSRGSRPVTVASNVPGGVRWLGA